MTYGWVKRLFIVSLFAILFFAPSFSDAAGLVPCGGEGEPACNTCHTVKLVHNVVTFFLLPSTFNANVAIVPLLGGLFLAAGGFLLLIGGLGGNPGSFAKGKQLILAVIIGFVIIYGAWLAINTGLDLIDVASWTGLGDRWWEIECGAGVSLTLSADPNTIFVGESTTLFWEPVALSSCEASRGWSGSKETVCSPTCSETITPPMVLGTYTYTLSCEGLGGTAEQTITVNVINKPPTVVAGPDQSVALVAGAILDGDVTDDGFPIPPAAFTTLWTMTSGPAGGSVTFGDELAIDTTATFTLEGDYVLRLMADDGGDEAFGEVTITVIPAPVITLSVSPDPIFVGDSITIIWGVSGATSCTASALPPTLEWDGAKDEDSGIGIITPTAGAGTYSYTLTCTGPGGTTVETVTLTVVEPPPVAGISATPLSGIAPLIVTFADASSGGPITDWLWDFGDGTPLSTLEDPGDHTYSDGGIYTVTLTVTGPGGSDTATETVSIVGLVGHWPFNDLDIARTIKDYGAGGNDGPFLGESFEDGTVFGAPLVAGKYGNGLDFNGVDQYVEIADSPRLDIAGQITIMAWINLREITGLSDNNIILNKDHILYEIAVHDNTGVTCGVPGDLIPTYNFAWYLAGLTGLPSHQCGWKDGGGPIPKDVWTHVALSYDGSAVRSYINSSLAKEYTGVGGVMVINDQPVRIGARNAPGPAQAMFNGKIDEVRLFDVGLTQAEIIANMNSPYPVKRPVASWSFENISASTTFDTHHIVKGDYGGAGSFDSINDLVEVINGNSFLPQTDITIAAWQRVDSATNQSIIDWNSVHGGVPANDNRITIHSPWGNGVLYADFGKCCFPGDGRISAPFPPAEIGNWAHIVLTVSSVTNEMVVYINGLPFVSKPMADVIDTSVASTPLYFGWHENVPSAFFDGALDDIKIWDQAFTAAQVAAEFASGP